MKSSKIAADISFYLLFGAIAAAYLLLWTGNL